MSILGNPVTFGGGAHPGVVAALYDTMTGNTYTTIGQDKGHNEKYFTLANSVLTCVKAGTYVIYYFPRGANSSSGTSITNSYRIYQNGTKVVDDTSGVGNAGTQSSVTVTLAAGDTIHYQCKASNSATRISMGIVICPSE